MVSKKGINRLVTNWLYYDSVYTERYMSTPSVNSQGYIRSAVNNVTAFSNVDFLLAHGTGDDNVHFANSASLLDKFTQMHVRGWRFRMFTDSCVAVFGSALNTLSGLMMRTEVKVWRNEGRIENYTSG